MRAGLGVGANEMEKGRGEAQWVSFHARRI